MRRGVVVFEELGSVLGSHFHLSTVSLILNIAGMLLTIVILDCLEVLLAGRSKLKTSAYVLALDWC